MQVELHPEARAEIRSAALWYEERRPGWGDRFVERLDETLSRIEETPAAHSIWPGTTTALVPIRRAFLEQFRI